MAQLSTCAEETNVCSICGRSAPQNVAANRCKFAAQAAGSFSYIQAAQEERAAGPHVL